MRPPTWATDSGVVTDSGDTDTEDTDTGDTPSDTPDTYEFESQLLKERTPFPTAANPSVSL